MRPFTPMVRTSNAICVGGATPAALPAISFRRTVIAQRRHELATPLPTRNPGDCCLGATASRQNNHRVDRVAFAMMLERHSLCRTRHPPTALGEAICEERPPLSRVTPSNCACAATYKPVSKAAIR